MDDNPKQDPTERTPSGINLTEKSKQEWKRTPIDARERIERRMREQFGRCAYCEEPMSWRRSSERHVTIDHAHPVSRGGPENFSNEVLACYRCNKLKGSMTAEEFRAARECPAFEALALTREVDIQYLLTRVRDWRVVAQQQAARKRYYQRALADLTQRNKTLANQINELRKAVNRPPIRLQETRTDVAAAEAVDRVSVRDRQDG